jgi:hypothetical protein
MNEQELKLGAAEKRLEKIAREQFPHGHAQFLPITFAELRLHSDKNHDYAKGGLALGNFERVAAILALYPELDLSDQRVVALVYALKQLDAVLWGLNQQIEHRVEGLNQRLQDISVYAKLVICMNVDRDSITDYPETAEVPPPYDWDPPLNKMDPPESALYLSHDEADALEHFIVDQGWISPEHHPDIGRITDKLSDFLDRRHETQKSTRKFTPTSMYVD